MNAPKKENPPFEEAESGDPISFTAYHWREGYKDGIDLYQKIITKKLKSNGLFVADTPDAWRTGASFLITMDVSLENPFVIHNDKLGLEGRLNRRWVSLLKRNGYDSIISVPDSIISTRQALLFYPNEQIKSAKYEEFRVEETKLMNPPDHIALRTWGYGSWRSDDSRYQIGSNRGTYEIVDTETNWRAQSNTLEGVRRKLEEHTGKRVRVGDEWLNPLKNKLLR